jgi:hypothetical protein
MKLSPVIAPVVLALVASGISLSAFAKLEFVSPFPSTVSGLSIPNAHLVEKGRGSVYRGMAPNGHVAELHDHGITDVLIFKENVGNDVNDEHAELQANGFPVAAHLQDPGVHQIPFLWDQVPSFANDCGQIVEALWLLENRLHRKGTSVFFHCTVGEDRTGLLAGLFRMVNERLSTRETFDREMCPHGYEAGNPQKPDWVNTTIRKALTPVFLKVATLIEKHKLTTRMLRRSDSPEKLAAKVCAKEPALSYRPEDFVCKASPLFAPQKE